MARTQPPQNPPPVMRLLVRYGKTGPARFASHRDYARALERGLRRAGVPMAYSSGFNPHQRVSYINPAPTGALSQAEYLVLGLRERVDPATVQEELGAVMPAGLPVLAVDELGPGEDSFPASLWQVSLPEAELSGWRAALEAFGSRGGADLLVTRETKKGPRTFDVTGPLESIGLTAAGDLVMVIRHTEPLVRPDDLVAGLRSVAPDLADTALATTRLAQGEVADLVGRAEDLA